MKNQREFEESVKEINVNDEAKGEIQQMIKSKHLSWTLDERNEPLNKHKFGILEHGDRVFEIAQIGYMELDIELVVNSTETKRPWLTYLIDAYSRRILAFYLSYETPSHRSCTMTLRECVKRFKRLPRNIVIHGGKEFNSIYFDSLLAMYGVTKMLRPPANARYGNVIENVFGITNVLFIHNLQGNTRIMKNVRQVTKSVNPKDRAIWTLESLNERLKCWINEVYDLLENPYLNKSPKDAFEQATEKSASSLYRNIPYDEFLLMTLPYAKGRARKVYPVKGIKVNDCFYWCEKFMDPMIHYTSVEVKYDPMDISIAFALIEGDWEKCYPA